MRHLLLACKPGIAGIRVAFVGVAIALPEILAYPAAATSPRGSGTVTDWRSILTRSGKLTTIPILTRHRRRSRHPSILSGRGLQVGFL